MAQSDQGPGWRPVWRSGQEWHVEYRRTVPSAAMRRNAPSPPPQISIWRYRVEALQKDGSADLVLEEQGGERRYRAKYDGHGVFVAAVRIDRDPPEPVATGAASQPYAGWSQTDPVIFDWPVFAGAPGDPPVQYSPPESPAVTQSLHLRDAGGIESRLVQTDASGEEETRSRLLWQPGLPWWQAALIEVEYRYPGYEPSTVIPVRGRLMQH